MPIYRTKLTDSQLKFGPGDEINTDDIPQGTSNLWLTPSFQTISGSKVFTNNVQIGGFITAAASGSTFNSLQIENNVNVGNNLFVGNQVYMKGIALYFNSDGPDSNAGMYFYDNGIPTGKFFAWINDFDQFVMSGDFKVWGEITNSTSGSIFNSLTIVDDLNVGDDLFVNNRLCVHNNLIYLNYGGPDRSSGIYFYDNTSPTNKYFAWDDGNSRFTVNANLHSTGDFVTDTSNGKGLIVKDATTGNLYRIRVRNGRVEAISV